MSKPGIITIGKSKAFLVRKKSSFMYELSYRETVLHFVLGGVKPWFYRDHSYYQTAQLEGTAKNWLMHCSLEAKKSPTNQILRGTGISFLPTFEKRDN